jgi:hypothetical protein
VPPRAVLPAALPPTGGEPGSPASLIGIGATTAFLFGLGMLWLNMHRRMWKDEVRVRVKDEERD